MKFRIYLFLIGFILTPVLLCLLPTATAAEITEKFTFPLTKHTSINTYFDSNSSQWAMADVSGTSCAIVTSTVTDANGDKLVNDVDFLLAFEKTCPWKLGTVYNGHKGIDFHVAMGADVLAAADGEVEKMIEIDDMLEDDQYVKKGKLTTGNFITIKHSDGSRAVYMHLQASGTIKYGLQVGSMVKRGDKIATADNNGASKGTHLHFEVRRDDNTAVDPFKENLWATDGTENITTIDHILTFDEYDKEASKETVPVVSPPDTPASPPVSIWQKVFNFFKGLFKPAAPGIGGEALTAIAPNQGGKVIEPKATIVTKTKSSGSFIPTTGTISTVAKADTIRNNIRIGSSVAGGIAGKRSALGLSEQKAVGSLEPSIAAPERETRPPKVSLLSRIIQFVGNIFSRLK